MRDGLSPGPGTCYSSSETGLSSSSPALLYVTAPRPELLPPARRGPHGSTPCCAFWKSTPFPSGAQQLQEETEERPRKAPGPTAQLSLCPAGRELPEVWGDSCLQHSEALGHHDDGARPIPQTDGEAHVQWQSRVMGLGLEQRGLPKGRREVAWQSSRGASPRDPWLLLPAPPGGEH